MVHVQQIASAVLIVLFGVLSLAVWRQARDVDRRAAGWGVAGAFFTVIGISSVLHALASWMAVQNGPGSEIYRLTVEWAPAANVGRQGTTLLLPVLLALSPRLARTVGVLLPAAAVLLVVLTLAVHGLHDGSIYQPMAAMAVLTTILAVLLMAVLLLALATDAMDRLLWLSMAVFALKEVMNVSLYGIVAWWDTAADRLAFWLFYGFALVGMAVMVAIAARRLALARLRRPVPALFERAPPVRPPALG